MDSIKHVGLRLKSLRTGKNLTQEDLEELSGINARYISAIERGQINITLITLEQLAEGLDVQLIDLLSGNESEPVNKDNIIHLSPSQDKKLIHELSQYNSTQIKKALRVTLLLLKEFKNKHIF